MSKLIDIQNASSAVVERTVELKQELLQLRTTVMLLEHEQNHLLAMVKVYTGIWE